jgi:hypothetical protein
LELMNPQPDHCCILDEKQQRTINRGGTTTWLTTKRVALHYQFAISHHWEIDVCCHMWTSAWTATVAVASMFESDPIQRILCLAVSLALSLCPSHLLPHPYGLDQDHSSHLQLGSVVSYSLLLHIYVTGK